MPSSPKLRSAFLSLSLCASLAAACSTPRPRVLVPARIDLSRFGTLGLVEFAGSGEALGRSASREFLAALQAAQPGTPVLELGDEAQLLAQIGRESMDAEAVRAIGERYRVAAVIVGELDAQKTSPKFSVDSALRWASASAELDGALDARILETRSGATVWTSTSRAREPLASVQISDHGLPTASGNAPEDARERLVKRLVEHATGDFWAHWE